MKQSASQYNTYGEGSHGEKPPLAGYYAPSHDTPHDPVGRDYPQDGRFQSPYEQYVLDKETGAGLSQPSQYKPVLPPGQPQQYGPNSTGGLQIDTYNWGQQRDNQYQNGYGNREYVSHPPGPMPPSSYHMDQVPRPPQSVGVAPATMEGSRQQAIELHKPNRSPRARITDSGDAREDPAYNLGTFRENGEQGSNGVPLRNGRNQNDGQETPWKIDLPQEEEVRRQSGYFDSHFNQSHDSGVHLNKGNEDQTSSTGNEEGPYDRRPSPYFPAQRNQQYPQDDEELYNDGGFGPPPRHRTHEPRQRPHVQEGQLLGVTDPASRHSSKHSQEPSIRGQPREVSNAPYELPGSRAPNHPDSEEEDNIVMSPTSYPGQEWMPTVDFGRSEGLRGWDD